MFPTRNQNSKFCSCEGCATEQLPGGQSKQCIFPFVYKGKTYTECTTVESANKKAWCATKVEKKL